jgi:hypothetical protein
VVCTGVRFRTTRFFAVVVLGFGAGFFAVVCALAAGLAAGFGFAAVSAACIAMLAAPLINTNANASALGTAYAFILIGFS